ncbi:unnamed protein product [Triticum turgidum subsp. durum]|uniref:Uncharacterized protein n=1 Tax=Triticum turgidum subsp. durum TaxID=4567 RepID=A0A9R0QNW0_TRITD|nr:unnamed protein product [Triticum turgidum subsp. durum]
MTSTAAAIAHRLMRHTRAIIVQASSCNKLHLCAQVSGSGTASVFVCYICCQSDCYYLLYVLIVWL